jgi:outer membrane protein TolC
MQLMISTLLLLSGFTFAQEFRSTAGKPTQLSDVIKSTQLYYPSIRAAQARISEREAEALAANGTFDPRIDGALKSRLGGYYDGSVGSAGLYKNLPILGAEIFTEYSISDGSFPVYEDRLVTANTGEAKVGLALSLLRDRDIDDERFAILKADLETDIASLSFETAKISIIQKAYVNYTQWLVSARLLEAYQELLNVVVVRGEALVRQVESGDVAEILLIENEQAILQRESLVVEANRQLELSAERLSLFLRDNMGLPVYPLYDNSLTVPQDQEEFLTLPVSQLVELALANRPDIAAAKVLQEQLQLEVQLAENLAMPKLDLKFYTARDFGEGNINRLGTDNVVEFSFSVPLETRKARGRKASANSRIIELGYDLRLLIDEAERDMRSALVNLRATSTLQEVALRELEVAQTLAEAEARRFGAGTSDYFLLNVRERMLGEAQLRRWQSELSHQIALANYYGISMNLPIIDELLE